MSVKEKGFNPHYDLLLHKNKKLTSCFNFRADMETAGNVGEQYVNEVLNNEDILIENKTDLWCARTGNLCLEVSSRNKASGISVTKADIWSFVIGKTAVLLVPTIILKKICERFLKENRYIRML